jgi:hypothetical protein
MPDARGYLLPNERRILLCHYAPVLVLFPEIENQAPYRDEGDAIYTLRGSYHPRAVEFFLKYSKIRYRRRVVLRQWLLFFRPRLLSEEIETIQRAVTREDLQTAIKEYKADPRYTGLGDADLRAAIFARLVQQRLSRRIRGFDLPLFRGHNLRHWTAYFRYLAETDPQTRRATVYGRLVQGLAPLGESQASPSAHMTQVSTYGPYDVNQSRVALQYWFQLYYDDWANRHEGDWESVTILLDLSRETITQAQELDEATLLQHVTAQDVGYASHEDGYRRLWPDVERTAEGRPIVYIARGSSASYFSWKIDGYPTSARVGFIEKVLAAPSVFVRGKRFLGRRWDAEFRARFTGRDPKNTDWVAADPRPHDRLEGQNYNGLERLIPLSCAGVRRAPDFGPDAGQDGDTYHLETDDLFWVEMVQEYGIQWGEDYFLPGTKGPGGVSRAEREKQRSDVIQLARLEALIKEALKKLGRSQFVTTDAIPELAHALRPLRPRALKAKDCFPESVRSYVYMMWASIWRIHPEAWPGGPGLRLRWIFLRQPKHDPLLARDDPLYHVKSLLAQVRRTRYELQNEGSQWDNPFAWVRYICRADTFFYGIGNDQRWTKLDLTQLDCVDVDMSVE